MNATRLILLPTAAVCAATLLVSGVALGDDVIIEPTQVQFYKNSGVQSVGDPMYLFQGTMQNLIDQSGLIHADGSSFGYVDRTTVLDDYLEAVPTHIYLNNQDPLHPTDPWGPFDGLQDVGVSMGYDSDATQFGPYWAGFDLGATYTVTSMVVWNGNLRVADLWTGETLKPDPDLYTDNLFDFAVGFTDTDQNRVGFTDPDQTGKQTFLLEPFVEKFDQPVTTRYISALFSEGPHPANWTYEIAFGIRADPLPVTLDLGETPLPVTVAGQLNYVEGDLQDVTPFTLSPGMKLGSIEIDLTELVELTATDPFATVPLVTFWLEDADGNIVSDVTLVSDISTVELTGDLLALGPGEYQLVADISQAFITTGAQVGATYAYNITTIPEPTTLALLGLGGVTMLTRRRSRQGSDATCRV